MGGALGRRVLTGGAFGDGAIGLLEGVAVGGNQVWQRTYLPPYPAGFATGGPGGSSVLTSLDLVKAYQLPDADGAGVTVGMVQFSVVPDFNIIQAYCEFLGVGCPKLEVVSVDGTWPTISSTGEPILDIVAMAPVIPAATIRFYYAANGWAGFLACAQAALAECDVVSCSWGYVENTYPNPEFQPTQPNMTGQFEDALREARSRNVSFFVASGDFGSDGIGYPIVPYPLVLWQFPPAARSVFPNAGFPSSCPSAVSVGATEITLNSEGIRESELACSFSGGGRSRIFPETQIPVVASCGYYQQYVTNCIITATGIATTVGTATPNGAADLGWHYQSSTSASCQFYAGVHARLISYLGHRFDFLDFVSANPQAFNDITGVYVEPGFNQRAANFLGTSGDDASALPTAGMVGVDPIGNGAFPTTVGRDMVTGYGSPNGPAIVTALANYRPATLTTTTDIGVGP